MVEAAVDKLSGVSKCGYTICGAWRLLSQTVPKLCFHSSRSNIKDEAKKDKKETRSVHHVISNGRAGERVKQPVLHDALVLAIELVPTIAG